MDRVQDSVRMVRVDTDQEPELAQRYHVVGIPAMIRLVRGEEQGRLIGFRPEDQVLAFAQGTR